VLGTATRDAGDAQQRASGQDRQDGRNRVQRHGAAYDLWHEQMILHLLNEQVQPGHQAGVDGR
jgi:hypothetical protein